MYVGFYAFNIDMSSSDVEIGHCQSLNDPEKTTT
jgi:hypothetical protein